MSVLTFQVGSLLEDAVRKEGVDDFHGTTGTGFLEPLGVLCAAYDAAPLSEVGRWILRAGLVHSLRMRLRAHEWVRRHPEILDERVDPHFDQVANEFPDRTTRMEENRPIKGLFDMGKKPLLIWLDNLAIDRR